ncbi:hypothetical protein D3C72_1175890 [compost metagenome]
MRAHAGHVVGGQSSACGGFWHHFDGHAAAADLATLYRQHAFLAIGGSAGHGAVEHRTLFEADLDPGVGLNPDGVGCAQEHAGTVCSTAADTHASSHGDRDRCRYAKQPEQGEAANVQARFRGAWLFHKFDGYFCFLCLRIHDRQVTQATQNQTDRQGQTVVSQVVQRQCTQGVMFHDNLQRM